MYKKVIDIDKAKAAFKKQVADKEYIASVVSSGKKLDKADLEKKGIKLASDVLPNRRG